jgi:hypothetical protein
VGFRYVVKCQNTPAETGEHIGAEGNEKPEWKLYAKSHALARVLLKLGMRETYNRDDFLLEDFGDGEELEIEGDVELQGWGVSLHGSGRGRMADGDVPSSRGAPGRWFAGRVS